MEIVEKGKTAGDELGTEGRDASCGFGGRGFEEYLREKTTGQLRWLDSIALTSSFATRHCVCTGRLALESVDA
jgi:hypothetical protein